MKTPMLYKIALLLIIMWALGFTASYSMGGFIHLLLVVALVMVFVGIVQKKRVL